jgi:hypothetical protein
MGNIICSAKKVTPMSELAVKPVNQMDVDNAILVINKMKISEYGYSQRCKTYNPSISSGICLEFIDKNSTTMEDDLMRVLKFYIDRYKMENDPLFNILVESRAYSPIEFSFYVKSEKLMKFVITNLRQIYFGNINIEADNIGTEGILSVDNLDMLAKKFNGSMKNVLVGCIIHCFRNSIRNVDVVIRILLTNYDVKDLIRHVEVSYKIYTNYFICHVLKQKYYKLKDDDYEYVINTFPDFVDYLKTNTITKCLEDMTCKQCKNAMVEYAGPHPCVKCCELNKNKELEDNVRALKNLVNN